MGELVPSAWQSCVQCSHTCNGKPKVDSCRRLDLGRNRGTAPLPVSWAPAMGHQRGTDIYLQVCCSIWSLGAFALLCPLWFPCRDWASIPVCRADSLSGLNEPSPRKNGRGGAGLCPGLPAAPWNPRGNTIVDPEDQHSSVRLQAPSGVQQLCAACQGITRPGAERKQAPAPTGIHIAKQHSQEPDKAGLQPPGPPFATSATPRPGQITQSSGEKLCLNQADRNGILCTPLSGLFVPSEP